MAIKEKQKSYCIICGKEADGIEIKIDNVIRTIRYIKKKLFKTEKNNRLVVSKECYETYMKNRKRYISRQRLYVGLGLLFVIFSVLIAPSLPTFGLSILILLFLYLISFLNYTPELKIKPPKNNSAITSNAVKEKKKISK